MSDSGYKSLRQVVFNWVKSTHMRHMLLAFRARTMLAS